ncbi:MAG: rhodanese-like domain-containing protein [Rhodothermia bacterium]|nr:rhodanese-like domain-containing protein [Rhodothermia bacterium]
MRKHYEHTRTDSRKAFFRRCTITVRSSIATTALAAGTLLIAPAGCSQDWQWSTVNRMIESDFPEVRRISTDSLSLILSDSTVLRPVLLDTRKRSEFDVSHIPGAIHVDPDAESFPALDSLAEDVPIVAYCSVGYRSSAIVRRLTEAGFTNAANLEGSIFKWANEGRTVVRGGAEVLEVHPYDRIWGQLLEPSLRAYKPGGAK